jgi:hypothetical protein
MLKTRTESCLGNIASKIDAPLILQIALISYLFEKFVVQANYRVA